MCASPVIFPDQGQKLLIRSCIVFSGDTLFLGILLLKSGIPFFLHILFGFSSHGNHAAFVYFIVTNRPCQAQKRRKRGKQTMTNGQNVFERYEKKYLLTDRQNRAAREFLKKQMQEDRFGLSTICSLYYDTNLFNLIRASVEKPLCKEKLRLRNYGVPHFVPFFYLSVFDACGNPFVYIIRLAPAFPFIRISPIPRPSFAPTIPYWSDQASAYR